MARAVVVATGVSADGRRQVLGCDVGDSENEVFWTEFMRSLKDEALNTSGRAVLFAGGTVVIAMLAMFDPRNGNSSRIDGCTGTCCPLVRY